jgi:CRP/FNR family cyclic AMP-dependent transcriptional regulator
MKIRTIYETDVNDVITIYRTVYGDDFPFQEFYDARWVKKGVYDNNIVWVVAVDNEGIIIGTAAVMLNAGDADDLIGEFGRLVVDPNCRTKGVGTALVKEQLERVKGSIEWGFAECRSIHKGAQKIYEREGFRAIGFEPLVYKLGDRRESMVLMARLFGNAEKLRKNNPQVITSVFPIGCQAMKHVGLEPDLIIAREVSSYPTDDNLAVEGLKGEHAYRLLRIGRGRAWERELFGGMRLEYGYLKLKSYAAEYLVAKREDVMTGAIGFTHDPIDNKVRLFELISADDTTKGTLLKHCLENVLEQYQPVYIEANVNAHYPRMQATLEQLGFFPVAFCPSMVFEGVERFDIVKMVKLAVPWGLGTLDLLPGSAAMKNLVKHAFEELNKGQIITNVTSNVDLFRGLDEREIALIRAICRERRYNAGEVVFRAHEPSKDLYIVLSGNIAIISDEVSRCELAEFRDGEAFGEMALIDREPRSAGAVCKEPCTLLAISYGDFHHLMDNQPELGKRVIQNLASILSRRLRNVDQKLEWRDLSGQR